MKLVMLAAKKYDTRPEEIFRAACDWCHVGWHPKTYRHLYEEFTAEGEFPEFVNDFALDVLANRVPQYCRYPDPQTGIGVTVWFIRPAYMLESRQLWPVGKREDYRDSDDPEHEIA